MFSFQQAVSPIFALILAPFWSPQTSERISVSEDAKQLPAANEASTDETSERIKQYSCGPSTKQGAKRP